MFFLFHSIAPLSFSSLFFLFSFHFTFPLLSLKLRGLPVEAAVILMEVLFIVKTRWWRGEVKAVAVMVCGTHGMAAEISGIHGRQVGSLPPLMGLLPFMRKEFRFEPLGIQEFTVCTGIFFLIILFLFEGYIQFNCCWFE